MSHTRNEQLQSLPLAGDDIRLQNNILREQLRRQEIEIFRLNCEIEEWRSKVLAINYTNIPPQRSNEPVPQISIILQNKDLHEQNQFLHEENVQLNGKNNDLEAQVRQLSQNIKRKELRIKKLNILEELRQERFKDEVARFAPVVVVREDSPAIKQLLLSLAEYFRSLVVDMVFKVFLASAKECSREKKTNSFTIFLSHWAATQAGKDLGLQQLIRAYEQLKKGIETVMEGHCQLEERVDRDTMNEWIINTLIDIQSNTKMTNKTERNEQKLFRMLGLCYRSKYPMKGELFTIDRDIKAYFEDQLCQQIARVL